MAWPTSVAGNGDLYLAKNRLSSTLAVAIGVGDTTITLADASAFPTVGIITIGGELIKYTGVSGNDLTGCTRGFDGTSPSAASIGALVKHNVIAQHHNVLKDEIIAVESSLDLTASRAVETNVSGRVSASSVTSTELGYLSGVTAAVQTQIGGKVAKAGDTMTGTLQVPFLGVNGSVHDSAMTSIVTTGSGSNNIQGQTAQVCGLYMLSNTDGYQTPALTLDLNVKTTSNYYGGVGFAGRYDTDNKSTVFGRVTGSKETATNGTRGGVVNILACDDAGTPRSRLHASGTAGTVITKGVDNVQQFDTYYQSPLTVLASGGSTRILDGGTPTLAVQGLSDSTSGQLALVAKDTTVAADIGGQISFYAISQTSVNNSSPLAAIRGYRNDAVSGSAKNGYLSFVTCEANNFLERVRISPAGNLGVNTTNPNAKLHVDGNQSVKVSSLSTDTTLGDHFVVLASAIGADTTLTLPAAASSAGRVYHIKRTNTSAFNVVIDGNGAETIDGAATLTISTQYQSYTVVCDGSNWFII